LQNIVSKHSSQFRGNAQHDALEFLLWLLDRMHEDLGAASPAQQTRVPEEVGGPCRGGRMSWLRRGMSSLTCPHCLKQSNTFDPFLCISLPIPLCQTRALNVTLVLQCERRRFVRVGLAVPLLGTVAELREMVAREGRIPPEQVILAEVSPRGFLRSLGDAEELGAAGEGAPLYAFQPPPARHAGTAPLLPGLCGAGGGGSFPTIGGRQWFGFFPLAVIGGWEVRCDWRGSGVLSAVIGRRQLLSTGVGGRWSLLGLGRGGSAPQPAPQPPLPLQGAGALFRIRLAGGSAPCAYLSPQDPRPLCHPAIDRALQLSGAGGPPHVKLTVEWDVSTKERLFGNIQEEVVQDAESVRLQQQAHRQQHSCTLDECFQLYTKEEQVPGTL
ncbi:Ubiquitin carboxyl-terminal hydrolase 43, partial [Eudyptes chrysocome]